MAKDNIELWIRDLGGSALMVWIRNPKVGAYLYGPPATGKTLFAEAWKRARPNAPQVITGNTENPKSGELAFFQSGGKNLDIAGHMRIKVSNPPGAAKAVRHVNFSDVVFWLWTHA